MALPHTPMISTPDEPKAKSKLDRQKAMVRYLDKNVGRLVKALEELGIRERTIIIFTTDNGSTASITGTRDGKKVQGAKSQQVEAGICAPFIVNCPGLVPAGVETNALTDFSDLLPTFVELGGGQVPGDLIVDGKSIASLLLGKEKDSKRKWIMALGSGKARLDDKGVRGRQDFMTRVLRDKRYKVWVSTEKKIIRLHDLTEDPWEQINLLNSGEKAHKKALAKFQKVLDTLPDKDARPLYEPRAENPWDKKARRLQ